MYFISLFELLLVVFAFYAAVAFEGIMRVAVVLLCLLAVFLFERLDKRIHEDEEVRERLLRYSITGRKKKGQEDKPQPRILKEVDGTFKNYSFDDSGKKSAAAEADAAAKDTPPA